MQVYRYSQFYFNIFFNLLFCGKRKCSNNAIDMKVTDKKTIMIVEDEPDLLEMLIFEFEFLGFHVVSANSGDEAFKKLSQSSVNVLLTDVGMPQGDGVELLKKVRKKYKNTKVFIMSGYSTLSEEEALVTGAQGYFLKPFRLSEVVSEIGKHLV